MILYTIVGSEKKRRLDERDKLIYAPMGDIGDVTYDAVSSRVIYLVSFGSR